MTTLDITLVLGFLLHCAPALKGTTFRSVVHPGHAALHVTRLHRYEHTGLESMLQAEQQWYMEAKAQEVRRKANMRGSNAMLEVSSSVTRVDAESPMFVKMSHVQVDALREHHMSSLQQGATNIRMIDELQQQGGGRDRMNPTGVMMQAVRKYHGQKHNPNEATTRLSSLSSQYVGPIGVGTVVQPTGCEVKEGEDVKFMQWLDLSTRNHNSGNLTNVREQCHVEDESQVWVVFDTGSTNIWVSSDLCKQGACAKIGRHRYNHTRSGTYEMPNDPMELSVQFGTGSVKGPQGVDDFHIGPFSVFRQTFALMEVQQGNVFEEVPFEGILGLAFKKMSANDVMPFFDNIVKQEALERNEFAFYFSLDDVTSNGIFWGGVDHSFFKGPIEYFPITDPYYWSTDLYSFKIGNEEMIDIARKGMSSLQQSVAESTAEQTVRAIVDTGTTFFTAEDGLFQEVMARLGTTRCGDMTDKTHPPISFKLQRTDGVYKEFILKKHQYMTSAGVGVNASCSPAFMKINIPKAHGPAMVLGECFLRQYYAVFDRSDGKPENAQIGFAVSEHGAAAVQKLRTLTGNQPTFDSKMNGDKSIS